MSHLLGLCAGMLGGNGGWQLEQELIERRQVEWEGGIWCPRRQLWLGGDGGYVLGVG